MNECFAPRRALEHAAMMSKDMGEYEAVADLAEQVGVSSCFNLNNLFFFTFFFFTIPIMRG